MARLLTIVLVTMLVACSGGEQEPPHTDHVWKTQTDMIDRARGVEGVLQDADTLQRDRIETGTQ